MKIAIISDVHDNIPNLKKVLDYCASEKIGKIICCGDLASIETLDFLNDNFSGDIFYCFGNMDDDYLRNTKLTKYEKIKIFKEVGEAEIENKKIAFVHFPDIARELRREGEYNFVFYGHTHKPWMENVDHCILLNPGNVANQYYPPTFAVWNTENDKFDLVRINEVH